MALLRRRVERIVVFVNTDTPIIKPDPTSFFSGFDTALMSFFGYSTTHECILLCYFVRTRLLFSPPSCIANVHSP
jgi:hypothetical protein